ncbi:MAG: phosphoribosylglycinamide formyltransferase [Solirubrobacteraceae bacterium]
MSFPVAVLASGVGTNLQALIDGPHRAGEIEIVGVACDVPGAGALERARRAGLPVELFSPVAGESRATRDLRIAAWVEERGAQLVVLAGYMQLLSVGFLERFPDAVLNVHPSLLPAFPGLHAIEQALDYGVRVFGVSVHLVDAGVDSGPIVLQRSLELSDPRTPEEVLAALRPLEHALLAEAVRLAARGALRRDPANPRRVLIDGYARRR